MDACSFSSVFSAKNINPIDDVKFFSQTSLLLLRNRNMLLTTRRSGSAAFYGQSVMLGPVALFLWRPKVQLPLLQSFIKSQLKIPIGNSKKIYIWGERGSNSRPQDNSEAMRPTR
jgi:hypothetical protein